MANYTTGMPNKEYWIERLIERFRSVEDIEKLLYKRYEGVYKSVLEDYVKLLKPYKMAGGEYDFKRLKQDMYYNKGFDFKVSRFQNLIESLDTKLTKYAKYEVNLVEKHLLDLYKLNYYEIIYEIEKGYSYNLSFAQLSDRRLKKLIHTSWTQDGQEFSDRIWKNKDKLMSNLRELMENAIASGESPRKTAAKLRDATGNSFYNSQRLIRTETTAIVAESDADAYTEMGFEEYRINATFDSRTSEVCGEMDGKKYKMSEMKLGTNAPPFHPNCRTTIEVVDIIDYQPPFKYGKNGDGKRVKIPNDMSFEEFKLTHGIT